MTANFISNAARRAKVFLPLVVLLLMLASGVGLHAQATDLHGAATQLTKKLHDDPDVQKINGEHIVIAPFENINGKGDAVPRILQEMLTTSFIKAKHFKVLERDQLQSALDELHFQLSDLADPAKAKKIGKLAGATYVLLGSISDTGGTTSINARIVSIESGESLAAEDTDIKTGDVASGIGGLNPAANPLTASTETTAPATAPKPQMPAIDLNAKVTSTSAGEYIGQKNNFGLLGGTKFQITWREALGDQPVYSFSAGDLLGNGSSRLVLFRKKDKSAWANDMADALQSQFVPDPGTDCLIAILKWGGQAFDQTWESTTMSIEAFTSSQVERHVDYVRILPVHSKPAPLFLSGIRWSCWVWNGTTYENSGTGVGVITETMPGLTKNLLAIPGWTNGYDSTPVSELDYDTNALPASQTPSAGGAISIGSRRFDEAVTANFDGGEKTELATAVFVSDTKKPAGTIEIYGSNGIRKAVTANRYGPRLAIWNPTAFKYPFLVAMRNTFDSDGKASGGYVYFIQWNGESYDEVWKSNRIDDAIIDMQVCDPKGEGKPGLVILSADKKGCYLTKIVHVN